MRKIPIRQESVEISEFYTKTYMLMWEMVLVLYLQCSRKGVCSTLAKAGVSWRCNWSGNKENAMCEIRR